MTSIKRITSGETPEFQGTGVNSCAIGNYEFDNDFTVPDLE